MPSVMWVRKHNRDGFWYCFQLFHGLFQGDICALGVLYSLEEVLFVALLLKELTLELLDPEL